MFEQNELIEDRPKNYAAEPAVDLASPSVDPVVLAMSPEKLQKLADATRKRMEAAAKELDFMEAARLRDEYFSLQEMLKAK